MLRILALLLLLGCATAQAEPLVQGKLVGVFEGTVCNSVENIEALWRAGNTSVQALRDLADKLGDKHQCAMLTKATMRIVRQVKILRPGNPPEAIYEVETVLGKAYVILVEEYKDPDST